MSAVRDLERARAVTQGAPRWRWRMGWLAPSARAVRQRVLPQVVRVPNACSREEPLEELHWQRARPRHLNHPCARRPDHVNYLFCAPCMSHVHGQRRKSRTNGKKILAML